jgi:hypothetical protein
MEMAEEEEQPPHFQNEGDSVRNLSMRAEERYLRHQQLEYTILLKVEEDDDENDAHFKDQLKSARTSEMEEGRPAHFRNEG